MSSNNIISTVIVILKNFIYSFVKYSCVKKTYFFLTLVPISLDRCNITVVTIEEIQGIMLLLYGTCIETHFSIVLSHKLCMKIYFHYIVHIFGFDTVLYL